MNRIMKKFIALSAFVLASAGTMMYAQETDSISTRASEKAQKEIKLTEEKITDTAAYELALEALKNKQFVMEADQVIFRNGMTAFVTSNTNFVLMNGEKSTVQVAFNTSYPGPNGIGGVTVDGTSSNMKMDINKKGDVTCSFSVQGIGISAEVFITMSNGSNNGGGDNGDRSRRHTCF